MPKTKFVVQPDLEADYTVLFDQLVSLRYDVVAIDTSWKVTSPNVVVKASRRILDILSEMIEVVEDIRDDALRCIDINTEDEHAGSSL